VDSGSVDEISLHKELRADGASQPEIMRRTKLSKASVYRCS
jgi:hypothetical protein